MLVVLVDIVQVVDYKDVGLAGMVFVLADIVKKVDNYFETVFDNLDIDCLLDTGAE